MPAFSILHQDNHVVVVNKDSGLLTTPAHGDECLVDLLNLQIVSRHQLAVVHRLDRLTSGVLVFARSPTTAAHLAKQFAAHSVEREYVAIVAGQLGAKQGTITVELDGQRAITHYEVLMVNATTTTLKVRLETGRRNQIRAHMAGIGHPILGDVRFGAGLAPHPDWPGERIALHARVLGFVHPGTKAKLRFEASLPAAFVQFSAYRVP